MAEVKKEPAKVSAAEAEVDETSSTVELDVSIRGTDVKITVPATFDDADPDVLLFMEQDKPMSAFRELIGEGQWRRLKALGWDSRSFREVIEMWQERAGVGNG